MAQHPLPHGTLADPNLDLHTHGFLFQSHCGLANLGNPAVQAAFQASNLRMSAQQKLNSSNPWALKSGRTPVSTTTRLQAEGVLWMQLFISRHCTI
eukprot:1160263-Pelagomonas_calceolata.AAC.2